MTHIERRALNALRMDGLNGVTFQHLFVCHADGSECKDGCDVAADKRRLNILRMVADKYL